MVIPAAKASTVLRARYTLSRKGCLMDQDGRVLSVEWPLPRARVTPEKLTTGT